MNRRHFLRQTALGLGVANLAAPLGAVSAAVAPKSHPEGALLTRRLGRTGIEVPIVSMGVMNANNPELLRQSYKSGIRHFDTAWFYQRGANERMVGRVLRELAPPREEYSVATKIFLYEDPSRRVEGREAAELFLRRFDESLGRLGLEYVDILYYHSIQAPEQVTDTHIIGALEKLKKQGKIRFTGLSTHMYWPELLNLAAKEGYYDVALLSYNYSMVGQQACTEALSYAAEKGMGLIAMKTQCQQEWYRDMASAAEKTFYEGRMMHSALLKWVMRHEVFATSVPGYTTFDQMQEDLAVARDLAYSEEEHRFLSDRGVSLALETACQTCGACRPSCPHGLEVHDLMRSHMYAFSYGNVLKARETLDSLKGRGLDACRDCGACTARCVRRVDIAGRIDELRAAFA